MLTIACSYYRLKNKANRPFFSWEILKYLKASLLSEILLVLRSILIET